MAFSAEIVRLVQEVDITNEREGESVEFAFASSEEVERLEAEYQAACDEVNRTRTEYYNACRAYNQDPSTENQNARDTAFNAFIAAEQHANDVQDRLNAARRGAK